METLFRKETNQEFKLREKENHYGKSNHITEF